MKPVIHRSYSFNLFPVVDSSSCKIMPLCPWNALQLINNLCWVKWYVEWGQVCIPRWDCFGCWNCQGGFPGGKALWRGWPRVWRVKRKVMDMWTVLSSLSCQCDEVSLSSDGIHRLWPSSCRPRAFWNILNWIFEKMPWGKLACCWERDFNTWAGLISFPSWFLGHFHFGFSKWIC